MGNPGGRGGRHVYAHRATRHPESARRRSHYLARGLSAPGRLATALPHHPAIHGLYRPARDVAGAHPDTDYELTDHTRTRRRLSELQGHDPMILVLSRGHFCPKDHQQHLDLAAFYSKINVAYTRIVTISTDNILESNEFRDAVGAEWTFLSDTARHVQKDLDIQEYTDPHHDP